MLIYKPVAKRDDESNAYKLIAGFLEEFLIYTLSTKKDLIDSVSRISYLEPAPPILIEEHMTGPLICDDGI